MLLRHSCLGSSYSSWPRQILSIPFKFVFAIVVPPTDFFGGFATFIMSLVMIGFLTALVCLWNRSNTVSDVERISFLQRAHRFHCSLTPLQMVESYYYYSTLWYVEW